LNKVTPADISFRKKLLTEFREKNYGGLWPGEVVVDAALAKAGIDVDLAILAKARQDLLQRNKP
jgi:hypothetical protein